MSKRTLVVNIRLDPFDTYIGRAGKGESGYFGNPHAVGLCRTCSGRGPGVYHKPGEAMALFRGYFEKRVQTDPEFRRRVLALRGQRLGCFCAGKGGITAADPLLCHGQVIAAFIDGEVQGG